MTTERNRQIGRDSIDRALALCVNTEKRRAVTAIEAGDTYFEKCGWWLSAGFNRTAEVKKQGQAQT